MRPHSKILPQSRTGDGGILRHSSPSKAPTPWETRPPYTRPKASESTRLRTPPAITTRTRPVDDPVSDTGRPMIMQRSIGAAMRRDGNGVRCDYAWRSERYRSTGCVPSITTSARSRVGSRS